MSTTLGTLGLIAAVCAVAAIVQRATGSGYGIVAAPLLALLAPSTVPGPLLVATAFVMADVAFRHRADLNLRSIAPVLAALPVGIVAGLLLTFVLSERVSHLCVAIAVLAGAGASLFGRRVHYTRATATAAGITSGILTVLAAQPGPPVTLVYPTESANRTRATLSLYFLIASILSLIPLAFAGNGWDAPSVIVVMCIASLAGVSLARPVLRLAGARTIRIASITLCGAAGGTLLIRTLVA